MHRLTGTPSKRAKRLPASETRMDVLNEIKNISTLKIFSYHLKENSSGGNFKILPPSNDVTDMISKGPSKKRNTRKVNRANPRFFSCIHLYPFGFNFLAKPFIIDMIRTVTAIIIVATIDATCHSFNVMAF